MVDSQPYLHHNTPVAPDLPQDKFSMEEIQLLLTKTRLEISILTEELKKIWEQNVAFREQLHKAQARIIDIEKRGVEAWKKS